MKTENQNYRLVQVRVDIKTLDDVRIFFEDLKRENLGIHPDDMFVDCSNLGISPSVAKSLDNTMSKCFEVCEELGADLYEIAADIFMPEPNN